MNSQMRRDPRDPRRRERTAASYVASILLHALLAATLFSIATSSSQQPASEAVQGAHLITVTGRVALRAVAVAAPSAAPPVPHASRAPVPRAQSPAAHHPRILHELAKQAPTAPPNPTPAPVASTVPAPLATAAALAPTPLPFAPAVPASVPTAAAVAVTVHVQPTAAPSPAPPPAPTQPPVTPAPNATPIPFPSLAPVLAHPVPAPAATPSLQVPSRIAAIAPVERPAKSASPGPRSNASPGPRGLAPKTIRAPARAVQVPSTPRPQQPAAARGNVAKHTANLNARLRALIPTEAVHPTVGTFHGDISSLVPHLPTPPPAVLARTKYIFEESPGAARWKGVPFGSAPEERYVKMYVTSVHTVGPLRFCTGWLVRVPERGNTLAIVEQNVTFLCQGHLTPFVPTPPEPSPGPTRPPERFPKVVDNRRLPLGGARSSQYNTSVSTRRKR